MSQKFDGYTIVRDLSQARDIMLHCISDYFHGKNRYKQSKSYLKYQKWVQKHTDPSYQNTYNFIKHNTELVDVDKKILFTLTDGAVYYRFEDNYYKYITTKIENTKTPETPTKIPHELKTPTPTEKVRKTEPKKTSKIPTHVDIHPTSSDAESLSTPVPTTIDNKDSPHLQDIVKNMEDQLDVEVESIQHEFTAAPTISPQAMQQLEHDIDIIQTRLNGLTGQEHAWNKIVENTSEKWKQLERETSEQLKQQQTDYTNNINKLHAKVTFISKQLELTESKVRNVDDMINKVIEAKVKKSIDSLSQRFHHIVKTAEHDVTATMLSFEHHVRKAKQRQVLPTNTRSSNAITSEETAAAANMKELFRKYRHKLTIIDERMEKWNLDKADRDLDTLLVTKLNEFDACTEKNLRKIEHIQQENAQVIEKNTSKIEKYTTLRTTIPPPSATTSTYKRKSGIDFEYRHIRRQFPP